MISNPPTSSKITNKAIVWQWNCRGLRKKKYNLEHHILQAKTKPDIILLQETNGNYKLSGYQNFIQPSITKKCRATRARPNPLPPSAPVMVVTYVANHIPAIQLETEQHNTEKQEHVAVECQLGATKAVIVNTYWTPGGRTAHTTWIKEIKDMHPRKDILIAGDFNSPNVAWGYYHTSPNGRRLETATSQHRLTLLNDTTIPTRAGNSVEADTSPDLTWHAGPSKTEWENTLEGLGSDHYILATTIELLMARKSSPRASTAHITKWDNLRSHLEQTDAPEDPAEWVERVIMTHHKFTKRIAKSEDHPYIDRHLLDLWDKRQKMVRRWKRNKKNNRLKKAIQLTTEEAQIYAHELATQTWLQMCDGLNGQLQTPRVWQILRTLLGQGKPRHSLEKLQLRTNKTPEQIAKELQELLYPVQNNLPQPPDYPTTETEDEDTGINSPFSKEELATALHSITRNTTPGKDGITYTIIKNLPENYLDALLDQINQAWKTGIIPPSWKEAIIIPIPKPSKPPDRITNLRPISLTSCLSKLTEKMVLQRLEWHLEEHHVFHHFMTGFRRHVSTQDTML